jgi:hypothetical protein
MCGDNFTFLPNYDMEPISTVALLASLSAVVIAVTESVKIWMKLRRMTEGRIRLKFEGNGKEVEIEYDAGRLDKLKSEELSQIVESLRSASEAK